MAGAITYSFLDHSGETGSMRLYTPDLNAGNIGTYTDDGVGGALGDMRIALSALTLGNHKKRTVVASVIADVAVNPTDPSAQRERKAMVTYRDLVTAKLHRVEIPAFDMTGAVPNTDILDVSGIEWQAFILLFEASFVSPLGNAIAFVGARHVGRSS